MERWNNRVAVVTGASSGIGAATALDLVKAGMVVAGLARRVELVEGLRSKLPKELQSKLHPVKCDVSDDQSVTDAFDWIEKNLGGVDVLVNNAGTAKMGKTLSTPVKEMANTLDINVLGVIRCTQRAFKSMKERNFDGHVIVINSVVGHKVLSGREPVSNVYTSSKHAITALNEILRQEFKYANTKIRMTSISPGLVATDLVSDALKNSNPCLEPEAISSAVLYAVAAPPSVNVYEMIVKPVGEVF